MALQDRLPGDASRRRRFSDRISFLQFPQTVKGTREAAHGLFAWALKRKFVTRNPVSDANAPKVIQGEVGVITASQLKKLLRAALKRQPRAVPALAVWAFCGVRRAEVTRLRFDDMDLERKELRVSTKVGKKGRGKVRDVPIPLVLLEWLKAAKAAWCNRHRPDRIPSSSAGWLVTHLHQGISHL